MKKPNLLLVDADQIFYQSTSGCQYETDFTGEEFPNAWLREGDTYLASNIKEAEQVIENKLLSISHKYQRAILCFTSTPNFRHDVLSTYKGGRSKKRKPIGYWDLVSKYIDGNQWETRKIPGLEADDVMSILATNPKYIDNYRITIWSQDKDMLQVPNTIIDRTDGRQRLSYDLSAANKYRYIQALAGDITDGYKGCPGIGPKKAEGILDSVWGSDESVYIDVVIDTYLSANCTVEEAIEQINCARILRFDEYDFKTKQPKLVTDE